MRVHGLLTLILYFSDFVPTPTVNMKTAHVFMHEAPGAAQITSVSLSFQFQLANDSVNKPVITVIVSSYGISDLPPPPQ